MGRAKRVRIYQSGYESGCSYSNVNLDPYIIGAILFLCNATPPTVLDLEGCKLDQYPAIFGRLSLRNFFGIGPRVPELGPRMWSKMPFYTFAMQLLPQYWTKKADIWTYTPPSH